MRLDFALLAQAAEFTPDGRFHVFGGGIDALNSQAIPAVIPTLAIVMRFIFPQQESGRRHIVRVTGVSAAGPAFQPPVDLPIVPQGNIPEITCGACFNIQPVVFPSTGQFFYVIELDGQEVKRLPVHVRHVPPPHAPPVTAPPSTGLN